MSHIEKATGSGKYRIRKITYHNGNESFVLEMATSFNRYAMAYEGWIQMSQSDDIEVTRNKRDQLQGLEVVSEEVVE